MKICLICQKRYRQGREATCSDECHAELCRRIVDRHGEFRQVTCMSTGVSYRVPTMEILEKGIRGEELDRYPPWEE